MLKKRYDLWGKERLPYGVKIKETVRRDLYRVVVKLDGRERWLGVYASLPFAARVSDFARYWWAVVNDRPFTRRHLNFEYPTGFPDLVMDSKELWEIRRLALENSSLWMCQRLTALFFHLPDYV